MKDNTEVYNEIMGASRLKFTEQVCKFLDKRNITMLDLAPAEIKYSIVDDVVLVAFEMLMERSSTQSSFEF